MAEGARVCVGIIAGAHGVRGLCRVTSFTADPASLATYGPLTDATGRREFRLRLLSSSGGQWLARIEGVADREAARALAGTELFVERSLLPPLDPEEFYHADLVGLAAVLPDGRPLGRVRAVHDFGAGDLIELALDGGGSATVPFTRAVVPVVDLAGGRVTIDPPEGLIDDGGPAAAGGS